MSAEQQGNVEAIQSYSACPIVSIVRREEDTRAFFDDKHLPYLQKAYRIPKEDIAGAQEVRDKLRGDTRYLEAYGQSILDDAYEQNELVNKAQYDSLTGLPKGKVWMERARAAIRQCEASGGREWLAVLFIDLSGFKLVNDRAGHKAGDVLLEKMGEGLRKYTRHEDVAAILGRPGGDEFTALLRFSEARIKEQMDREERTARAGKRIAGLLDTMFAESLEAMRAEDSRLEGLVVTAVTGCATWKTGMTAEQVFGEADDAMNENKNKRKEQGLQSLSPEERTKYDRALGLLREIGWGVDPRDGTLKRI